MLDAILKDLGPHWGFIVASYVISAAVLGGLVAWILADLRAQRRTLADLEARGVRRRSSSRPTEVEEAVS